MHPSQTAVLLVPGLGHHRRGWMILERLLRRAGFAHVGQVADAPYHLDVTRLARHLARHVDALRLVGDAERFHVVGQNVGGIVARYFVQLLDGRDVVDTVVTLGTPHRGTTACPDLAPGAQLHPDSFLLRRLEEAEVPETVEWVNYLSGRDTLVQPPHHGILKAPGLAAENLVVSGQGDLSLVLSPAVCRSIVHRLVNGAAVSHGDPLFAPNRTPDILSSMARHPSSKRGWRIRHLSPLPAI